MVINREHIPYCICFYDGSKKYSFYLSDFSNYQEMVKAAVNGLLRSKYSGYVIYVHNLSKFDGVFLLNPLIELRENSELKFKPIVRDGNIIELAINYGPNFKYNITFQDSYLLTRHSLKDLSMSFEVEHVKTTFPFKFMDNRSNEKINLDYVGTLPNKKFFNSNEEYVQFAEEYLVRLNLTVKKKITKNNIYRWSLKEETILYCTNDCVSLYEVMIKFNEFIFNKWNINAHGRPTVSSLSMAIFRANHLSNIHKKGYYIPLINGQTYLDIKRSYTGGAVDMYKPQNVEGELTFEYDQNSQFPFCMSKGFMMPVVTKNRRYIKYFEGNILAVYKNPFGFFNVNVRTTRELEHPILQIRHKIVRNMGVSSYSQVPTIRTIAPLGEFTGMFLSEELRNAAKFGYEFEVVSGYQFEKCDVFEYFVDELYDVFKFKRD